MKKTVERMLDRWGVSVEICTAGETVTVRGILEPTTSLSWQNMRRQMRALGNIPQGQFLYIGPRDISEADVLRRRGKSYYVRRCEEITLGNETLCYWGLCVPSGEEAAWSI